MKENKKGTGCVMAFLIIVVIIILVIFVPEIIKDIHETKLIKNGKIVSAQIISEKFVEELKIHNFSGAKQYLSNDCEFYNNGKVDSINSCLENLTEYSTHKIEKRGNSIKDEETYRVYWNGNNYENTNQIITLLMRRKVNKKEITYEIYKIIFTNN